jgi:WhiB family redox-sensing transcriptional regulator
MTTKTWRTRAVCRGAKTNTFFCSDENHDKRKARTAEEQAVIEKFCNRCPVSGNCLTWALDFGEKGIWGGTLTRERHAMKRVRHRSGCPRCQSRLVTPLPDGQACALCGLSWRK